MIVQSGKELKISGGIKYGLTAEASKLLSSAPEIKIIDFESSGGRISEATKLYELIVSHNLNTVANAVCLSACTIAFAGGTERWVGTPPVFNGVRS